MPQSDRPKVNSKSKFGFLALVSGVFEDEFPSDISLLWPFGSIPFHRTKNEDQNYNMHVWLGIITEQHQLGFT